MCCWVMFQKEGFILCHMQWVLYYYVLYIQYLNELQSLIKSTKYSEVK